MILFLLFFFILGSAIGSFLNVVIDRTTRRESILGRSYCEHCKATLKTVDLVPIFSFVGLGGRCRYCKKPVSWQYPLVEGACGLLFTLSFFVLSTSQNLSLFTLLYYFFIASILVIIGVIDIKFSLIPTSFVYLATLVSLSYNFFSFPSTLFIEHVAAAVVASAFFFIIVLATRGRGMGEGDIVVALMMGMVLGFAPMILAVFLAFLLGAVVSIFLILGGKKHFGQTVPFAPFLVIGFLISLYWAKPIINWYLMVY